MASIALEIYPFGGFTEPVSSWTHLGAAGIFLISSVIVLCRRRSNRHRVSIIIFAFSCIFLLSMSGVYHLLPKSGAARAVLQHLDHAGIYVMIAATFTAVHNNFFSGIARWGVIAGMWSAAALGIVVSVLYFNSTSELVDLIVFLALGWVGAVSGFTLYRRYGFAFVKPLLYGGVAYTVGAVFEFLRIPTLIHGWFGPHEAFHLAVLAGLLFHWKFVRYSLEQAAWLEESTL